MRYQRLDLNLLALFEELLRNGNVSKAAINLNMTQPAVSNALSRLRQHFDDPLFVLIGRRMMPTPFALSLVKPIEDCLVLSKYIAEARAQFDPTTSDRRFTLLASDYVALTFLTRLTRRLAELAPHIGLHHMPIADDRISAFDKGDIDLMIAPDYIFPENGTGELLFEDRFVVIADQDNDVFGTRMSLEEYLSASHVVVKFGARSLPSKVEVFMAGEGLAARTQIVAESFFLLADFVNGSSYIATVPRRYARVRRAQLPIRLIQPDFELPTLRENLYTPAHLATDPGVIWLKTLIRSEAALWATED